MSGSTTVNGSATHSYDADGNETTVNGQTASYDFENHLVSLATATNGTVLASYVYDADGNRVSTYVSSATPTTTSYVVDTSLPYASVVEEYTGASTTPSARYDYGDDLVRMDRGSGVYYYIYDGLESTRQLVNSSGAVTDSYGYSAFGEMAYRTSAAQTPTVNPFLFNAQQFDQASGDYYLRARYYDQSNGRFISQDPFGGSGSDPVTLHRYLYASGNPVSRTDPSGQADIGETVSVNSVQSFLAASLRFALVNSRLAAFRVVQTYYTNAAAHYAINLGVGIVLTAAGDLLSNITASRPDSQWAVANRPANSVWNLNTYPDFFERGNILEDHVLGRPATINGVPQATFKTIDDFNGGVATSIESIDLTLPTYNNSVVGATNLTNRLDSCALALNDFSGDQQLAGGTTFVSVQPEDIDVRELRIAIEPGATNQRQATAMNEWLSTSRARFPNINVVIQEVEAAVPAAVEEVHE